MKICTCLLRYNISFSSTGKLAEYLFPNCFVSVLTTDLIGYIHRVIEDTVKIRTCLLCYNISSSSIGKLAEYLFSIESADLIGYIHMVT